MKRSSWPIVIGFVFAVAIASFAGVIIWSLNHREELVSDDYYEKALGYEERITAINRAINEGLKPTIRDGEGGRVDLVFPKPEIMLGATGTVVFYRPSNAAMDRQFPLVLDTQGVFTVTGRGLAPGKWRAKIDWKIGGKSYFAEEATPLP